MSNLKSMDFTDQATEFIRLSRQMAIRHKHDFIGLEHFLYAMLECKHPEIEYIFEQSKLDRDVLLKRVKELLPDGESNLTGNIPLTRQAERCLKETYLEAKAQQDDFIDVFHLLASMCSSDTFQSSFALREAGLNADNLDTWHKEFKGKIGTVIAEDDAFQIIVGNNKVMIATRDGKLLLETVIHSQIFNTREIGKKMRELIPAHLKD